MYTAAEAWNHSLFHYVQQILDGRIIYIKVKVTLEQATKAQGGRRRIALLFL